MSEPDTEEDVRVLYSFPHKIGAPRICTTAWFQVAGASSAGASIIAYPGAVARELPVGVTVFPTLARGRARIPYRALGRMRALALHDHIVARRLPRLAGKVDVVHVWPLAARRTIRAASRLGLPTVLERPNAHTRFAYETVRRESQRLGVALPADHEHAYNPEVLKVEEEEYALTDYLLCPSPFVKKTFIDQGFPPAKLLDEFYGYDPNVFYPPSAPRVAGQGLKAIQIGVAAVRKGQHFAVEAWLKSSASRRGTFSIVGEFLPAYRDLLAPSLADPSIEVLGHRSDVPALLGRSDVLVLPTLEEGSALVCPEAMACGCVPVVSLAASGLCRHMENALVHEVGDVATLAEHLTLLDEDRTLLGRLREGALATAAASTWEKAGAALVGAYRQASMPRPEPAAGG